MENKHPMLPANWDSRSLIEKRQYLEANADKIKDDQTVRRPLSDDELESKRYKLQEQSIELSDLNDEYEEVKKHWRERINDAKDAVAETLGMLKQGFETVSGSTYDLRDHEEGRVYIFMADGTEIDSRRMLPEERQQTIQSGMRKVENDN